MTKITELEYLYLNPNSDTLISYMLFGKLPIPS